MPAEFKKHKAKLISFFLFFKRWKLPHFKIYFDLHKHTMKDCDTVEFLYLLVIVECVISYHSPIYSSITLYSQQIIQSEGALFKAFTSTSGIVA